MSVDEVTGQGSWTNHRARANAALRARHNWVQLLHFCLVGASGYAVNLAVYWIALSEFDLHFRLAATISFVVAATNNYTWNRLWTFRRQRGHVYYQGLRFFVVSVSVYLGNLVLLSLLVAADVDKLLAQAIAIMVVTPGNFIGNKLWSFRR